MNAEIIAIGTELLLGQITNTNAAYLSRKLAELGIDSYYQTVVGDNKNRLKKVIEESEARSTIHIFVGGLGPTKDDITKEVVAEHLGLSLTVDEAAEQKIVSFFKKTNRSMTENNKKQSINLENSKSLSNNTGMAVGTYLEIGKHTYILLPGPPAELEPMFENEVKPLLLNRFASNTVLLSRTLCFFGIGESALASELDDLIEAQQNPTIATYAGNQGVEIRLTSKEKTKVECQKKLTELDNVIQNRVGEFFYGYGEENSLSKVVKNLLVDRKMTLTAAESLTGGAFQGELASVDGASECFVGGVVTYSKEMKQQVLGVSEETISKNGVVSAECAIEMAVKAREIFKTDIGISFTGVAGPASLENKVPGSVWIGISRENEEAFARHYQFAKDRNSNRKRAVLSGFDLIRRVLLSLPISEKMYNFVE